MNLIFKLLILAHSFNAFLQRKVFIKNIKKEDLVLDVGSGDKPFWRADVIVDKYIVDNQQRHSGSILFDRKKIFIEADVQNLPFKDKVFDFVFCSHLLEHVENPSKAIAELTRVGKRGYIEVPNAVLELLDPFPSHLWYCSYTNDALIFKQKNRNNDFLIDNIQMFGKSIIKNNIFQYLLNKNINKIFICLYWENNIEHQTLMVQDKNNVYKYKENLNNKKRFFLKTTFLIYKIFYEILVILFYKKKNFKIERLLKPQIKSNN